MNQSKAYFTPSIFMLMIPGVFMLMVCVYIHIFLRQMHGFEFWKSPFLFEKPWLKRFSWNIS